MQRIFQYTIPQLNTPISVKAFLKQQGFSGRSLIVLKAQEESVLVNNQPVYINHLMQPGDELEIRLAEEKSSEYVEPVELPLNILYEDEDLMVVNKPAGMPIHPSQNNRDNSLANALAWYFAQQNRPFVFRCINRLDRDTSGLTIIAKNVVSAGILSAMVAAKGGDGICREQDIPSSKTIRREQDIPSSKTIRREYLAIAKGKVTPSFGTINAPIARKEDSIIERIVDFENGEKAVTHYKLLHNKNGHSLISLLLETGRTHQIRVHMKYLGFPLIGDYLYNPDTSRMTRQALHAYKLDLEHPITGQPMSFTAPLPEDMRWML
ncbi:MAG: RluA family pseudouridine synthase [Lachnospiraceae bacterium]|nr:RluA family pseudouridine synthase [Lachnospiraceae bacterium]